MSDKLDDRIAAAGEALADGDARQALRELRWIFFELDVSDDSAQLSKTLKALAPVFEALAVPRAAEITTQAAEAPEDAQMLYDLGYALIELGLTDIAICPLARANRLAPGQEPVVTELVAALEREGHNQAACEVLRAEEALCEQSFTCRYLLAFNSVMSADLESARQLLPQLSGAEQPDQAFMARRIEQMLRRADSLAEVCPLDDRDLRGWHFVTTGGLLLHVSPYGQDEGMNGRYAYVSDTPELCLLGLRRAEAVLEAMEISPPWILAPEDRDSQILAAAAEEVLGLPMVEYSPDAGPGLIVTYDLARVPDETLGQLVEHQPGQVLLTHATCWTSPPVCAPDITTLLYQAVQAPWDARTQVTAQGEPVTRPADTRPADEVAQAICGAEVAEELAAQDPLAALTKMAQAGAAEAAASATFGRRSPLWEGGPVPSGRFF